jgi:predicted acyltransferase
MVNKDETTPGKRLLSLDALRGFDMLWISGGEKIIIGLAAISSWPPIKWAASQMDHVPWNGFAFYDIIFPLFLFIAGVSLPFSLAKRLKSGESKTRIYWHLVKRMLLLIMLGCIYNGLLNLDFETMRYASVLARIGIAWFFAAIIIMNASVKWQIIWFWGILISYCLIMMLVPVPGFGAGILTTEGSLAAYLDRLLLPGTLYLGVHDPEGILSTIPAISTALLGALTGSFLKSGLKGYSTSDFKKAIIIILAGVVSLILGKLWGTFFPINKNLWTSSFVLYAGGWSLILLGIFYLVIDVWGFKKWAFPFIVIGLNSITVYMLNSGIINFDSMTDYFFAGIINLFNDSAHLLIYGIGYVLCVWTVLYIMYRYKIFLKV